MLSSEFIILPFLVGFITAHPPPVDPSCYELKTNKRADDCCKTPGDLDDALIDSCVAKLDTTLNDHELENCLAECIAQKLGLFKNQTLDKVAAKQFFAVSIGNDANFAPIIGGVFDKCYEQVAAIPEHKNAKCNFIPNYLMNCVDVELFKICPSAVWDVSDGCVELKSKLAQGCPYSAIAEDR